MSAAIHRNAPEIARQEFRLFLRMAELTGMDADRQRHSLRLSHDDWQQWLGVVRNAPVPSRPALPLMLRHLGYLNNQLARKANVAHAYA